MAQYFGVILITILGGMTFGSVSKILDLEVKNGGTLKIRKFHLNLPGDRAEACKVQVIDNEPMYQRVGLFTPKVFDCDFSKHSVRYQHNGSPFLSEDHVKLRVSRLLPTETIQETLHVRIRILNADCQVIKLGTYPLVVPSMNGVSNPIRKDVVHFDYDRLFRTKCELRIADNKFGFPEVGHLVIPKSPIVGNREYEPLSQNTWDCDDFLLKGIRYQHMIPPTPDVDYIPLHVVIKDRTSQYILKQEYRWLPVQIKEAFPNQNPTLSFSNSNIMEVDEFVTTNLLSTTMSATDSETNSGSIFFNITYPPENGFLVHLNDESKPIESFYQKDITDLKIAYQPPNVSYSERVTFFAEFIAYDSRFAKSDVIRILITVRVSHTTAPRVSWNMGLTMLEGQSRKIDKNSLQVVYQGSLDMVRMTLAGGLQHGKLLVDGQPGYSFTWIDIENRNITYQHDDSDSIRDFIMFQISDILHSTRFKLPIEILPKDDSPPILVNNVLLEGAEGQIIRLYTFLLESYDEDSSSDFVKFNITRPPKAGQIQKRKQGESSGWQVRQFQQQDLNQGNIIYKHSGDEIFEDSFDFVLMDSADPYPNISPLHTARIKLTPVDDQPPIAAPDISRSLIVDETDIGILSSDMLSYIDEENPGSPINYIITDDVKVLDLDRQRSDAGQLFHTDDMVMPMKAPGIKRLKMFSQDAIDHNKVAYMPPLSDIGLRPLSVVFTYSVNDSHGTTLDKERFLITILPVDNQPPQLKLSDVKLREGENEILSEFYFNVTDEDTPTGEISFIIIKVPNYGVLKNHGLPLLVGDNFTYGDVTDFSVQYSHNGFENFYDSFELLATDGNQNSTVVAANVAIKPVDDEIPEFLDSDTLKVNESSFVVISSDHIHATDIDTEDEDLIFFVISPPSHGTVILNDETTLSFKQRDITNGNLQYKHNGDEIGPTAINDVIAFTVSDREIHYDSDFDIASETLDLNVTILPVNNRPPELLLGSAVFHCDEGGKHVLTQEHMWAADLDTPAEKLIFKVSTPKFGYVEDQTPREGYEKQISVPVNSFTLKKLEDGMIYYVQSHHRGIEPTVDTFTVSVSDGKHTSAEIPFLIAIEPVNDEAPKVQANNFSCDEGGMFPISESVLLILDLDVPKDDVMVSVFSPPEHGMLFDVMLFDEMLFDEMEMRRAKRSGERHTDHSHLMHEMDHMREFSMHDWSRHMVQPAYLHDGTENSHDSFKLKINDGKHIYMADMGVTVYMVNDEKPTIVTNKGISVELGDNAVLSSVVLYAKDGDNPDQDLVYMIHSIPNHGYLQRKGVTSSWSSLQIGDLFTEVELAANRLRYLHTDVFSSRSRDSFRFSVSDGTWITQRQNFEITIKHKEKGNIHIVTGDGEVKEGETVYITTDLLNAKDGFDRTEDISYEIVMQPMYGHLEYVTQPFHPINHFSQLDIMSRKILYRHQSKEDSLTDTFIVEAGNGIQTKEGAVTIKIIPVDIVQPTVILFPNIDSGLNVINVFRGASVTINEMTIHINDPDTLKDHVQIIFTSLPDHGEFILAGEHLGGEGRYNISLTELENDELMYENNGDGSDIDRFAFTVSDGTNHGYLLDGETSERPIVININVEHLDDVPPIVTVNRLADSVEPLGSRDYALYIDSHTLMATDEGSESSDDIVFSITEPPSYGTLKKKEENGRVVQTSDFSATDLKTRKLLYVVDSKHNVTNDSFMFDVQDGWGNIRMGSRYFLSWARIEIDVGESMTLCENTSSSIGIKRYGNLRVSSFVGAKVVLMGSVEQGRDFNVGSAKQIQFDPGSQQRSWLFSTIDDRIKERKEKFKLLLHSAVNAVLEPQRKVTVVSILDAQTKSCQQGAKPATSEKENRHSTKSKKRSRRRKGKKHRRKNSHHRFGDLLQDESEISNDKNIQTRKYGKLGKPATVAPSEYFSNKTHRKWTYHGIIPLTIDEEKTEHTPRLNTEKSDLDDTGLPSWNSADNNIINDESSEHSLKQLRYIMEVPKKRPIPMPCTRQMNDRLYYDNVAETLMRCNGAKWVEWSPSELSVTAPEKESTCEDGWHSYEDKCYFIQDATLKGESWNSAQRKCREEFNAHLATITSKKNMNWLRHKTKKQKLWIGLNKKVSTDWEWTGGGEVTFVSWKGGYPSAKSQRKRSLLKCTLASERKHWSPKKCDETIAHSGFICMKQKT